MIEGIKIDMPVDELREHARLRAEYHTNRAKFYANQAKTMRAGGVEEESASNDPIGGMERKNEHHAMRATFFQIVEKHLVAGETYRLAENDLTRLEFVERYY